MRGFIRDQPKYSEVKVDTDQFRSNPGSLEYVNFVLFSRC